MGSPKALLTIGGTSFLQHIAETVESAGVRDIIVVLGADNERIRGEMSWFSGTVVVNKNWNRGQLSSIIAGLGAAEKAHSPGAMICPVDHPLITKRLVSDLVSAFRRSKKKIVVPAVDGLRGHPVIFDASLFEELRLAPEDTGARAVVRNHPADLELVHTHERGAITDIATAADYEREIAGRRLPGQER